MSVKWAFLRHPRTTQERRANQDRNDPYVRGKRRKLPTAWDDQIIRKQKSWKYLSKRRRQWRVGAEHYRWHEFDFSWREPGRWDIARNIMNRLEFLGFFYEPTAEGLRWFGPEMRTE